MKKVASVFISLLICGPISASAGVIIDTGTPTDQATLDADGGQTFTTGTLGDSRRLSSISIYTAWLYAPPIYGNPTGPFVLELYTDMDGDYTTWDPGSLVAASSPRSLPITKSATLITFTFKSRPLLSDNTVYAFTYTDGSGTRVAARMSLTDDEDALTDGYLFADGDTPLFGDAFDTAMRIFTGRVAGKKKGVETVVIPDEELRTFPSPQKEKLTIAEVRASLIDLDGKVVEVTANWFRRVRQEKKGEYSVWCYYYENYKQLGDCFVLVSGEDGREFFKDRVKREDIQNETFYVYVRSRKVYAIGRRYRKSKNEYSW